MEVHSDHWDGVSLVILFVVKDDILDLNIVPELLDRRGHSSQQGGHVPLTVANRIALGEVPHLP